MPGSGEGIAETSRRVRQSRGNGAAGGAALARIHAKLKLALENGNLYEAHQLYRTIYFRLQSQRRYMELEQVLFKGALAMFDGGERDSGVDLTKLYIDVLQAGNIPHEEETFVRIARLYALVPLHSPDRESIMASAIKWSTGTTETYGHPRLHQIFAYSLWRLERYPESRQHFLHSSDGEGCGTMLAEFHQKRGYRREVDIFIVGTVLQLICQKKHIVAALALKSYTEKHPSLQKGPPYLHPLLNFVWFLLLAIEHKRSLEAFTCLIEKYKPGARDPAFLAILDKIGQIFFGVPIPAGPRSGMLPGIFDSVFNALADDDEDSDANSGRSSATLRMEMEDVD